MFHDMKESLGAEMALALYGVAGAVGVETVSARRDEGEDSERGDGEREGPWDAWYCALLEGLASQRQVKWLKA